MLVCQSPSCSPPTHSNYTTIRPLLGAELITDVASHAPALLVNARVPIAPIRTRRRPPARKSPASLKVLEADEIDAPPNAHARPGNVIAQTVPLRTRKHPHAHVVKYAHANPGHVIVRTAPIRQRILPKLASELFFHVMGRS